MEENLNMNQHISQNFNRELEGLRARLHIRAGDPSQALEHARTALGWVRRDVSNRLSSSDKHLNYRALIAEILQLQGKTEEARAELEPHEAEGIGSATFVVQYVSLLIAGGEEPRARDYLRRARLRRPNEPRMKELQGLLEAGE